MHVKPEEFRTTRELAREVASCLEALRKGDVEKIVVTQNGKPAAILIDVATFENMLKRLDNPGDEFAKALDELGGYR